MNEVLKGQAKAIRSIIKGELRIVRLDCLASPEEIRDIIAENGKCLVKDVKVGDIREMRNTLGMAWVQCPLATAIAVASKRKLRIGWTMARVELLESRPVQCFRCWGYGHVRFACTSPEDRSKSCFRCGEEGHIAIRCEATPRCGLCRSQGRNDGHRMGSTQCGADRRPAKNVKKATGQTEPARGADDEMEVADEN